MGDRVKARTLGVLILFLSFNIIASLVQSSVLVLDDSNFNDAIASHEHLLVVLHTKWCQHCRRLMPKLDRIAASLAEGDAYIQTAKFDAGTFKEVPELYSVIKYPTLLLFTNQTPREYNGLPSEAGIVQGVSRLAAPAVTHLHSDSDFDALLEKAAAEKSAVFLSVKADEEVFEVVAEGFKERLYFAKAKPSQERLAKWGVQKEPSVLALYPPINGPDDVTFHAGPFDDVSLRHFVALHALPPIVALDEATWQAVTDDSRPIVLVIGRKQGSAELVDFVSKVNSIARLYRESFLFASVATAEHDYFTRSFGVRSHSALPTIRVWDHKTHYWQIEDTTDLEDEETDVRESLRRLLEGVNDGSLKARTTRRVENPLEFLQDFVKQDGQTFVVAVLLLLGSLAYKAGYVPSWLRFGWKGNSSSEKAKAQGRTHVAKEYQKESESLLQKKVC